MKRHAEAPTQKPFAFRAGIIAALVTAIVLLAVITFHFTPHYAGHDVRTNEYAGRLQTNWGDAQEVTIDENDVGLGFDTIVNLVPVGAPSYQGITGHIDHRHSEWTRIFYCGANPRANQDDTAGCNSVIRTSKGWKFVPCPGDVGKVHPFTDSAINYAISQLDLAMKQIHNQEHLTAKYQWDQAQKKVVLIYKRS